MSAFRIPATLAVAILVGGAPAVQAADWHTVVAGKTESVAIDRVRVARSSSGIITAWSRLNLARDVQDVSGTYNAVEAYNRYDCESHRFATLRRAYMNGDQVVREETVAKPREMKAMPGSIDDRLLGEACRARNFKDGQATGDGLASDGDERPGPMHADMRSLAEAQARRIMPVADASPRPVTPAAPAAPSGERPRMIELPKIDKEAAAQAAGQTTGKPEDAKKGDKPADKKAMEKKVADKRPAGEPVPATGESASAIEKRARELQLATSGPRRAAAKKKEEAALNPAQESHVHWGYDGEGAPANWARLRGEYATCGTGKRQSPIDIRDGIKVDLEAIKTNYKTSLFRVIDNGHTLQVNVGEGSTLNIQGKRYELQQFHFHRPSEERINGRAYDMVMHLVHRNDDGELAVIAVLLEKGNENPQIQTVWNNMPLERDMEMAPAEAIDLAKLLPEKLAYWTYMGSLTTPPCTEGVLWIVLKQPLQVSPEQVGIFSRLYRNNSRPIQPPNGRLVKESR